MFTFRTRASASVTALASVLAAAGPAAAGTSGAAPTSYPLYCQGRLDVVRDGSFLWATTIAKNVGPGPGECSWLDRVARGEEIHVGPRGNVGLLCPVAAIEREVEQYDKAQYFLVNVASLPAIEQAKSRTCLTPTSAPVALTPENRPWPVVKNPADGPKPANAH